MENDLAKMLENDLKSGRNSCQRTGNLNARKHFKPPSFDAASRALGHGSNEKHLNIMKNNSFLLLLLQGLECEFHC